MLSAKGRDTERLQPNNKQYKRNVGVLMPSESDDDTLLAFQSQAQELATRLSLPLLSRDEIEEGSTSFTHCLSMEPYKCLHIDSYAVSIKPVKKNPSGRSLIIKKKKTRRKSDTNLKPFCIDLCPGSNTKMAKRLSQGGQKGGELLLKATALGKNEGSTVYDLTAGLAQDSCIMALGGASTVHMVEKDSIVIALLEDAFRRMRLVADMCTGTGENAEDGVSGIAVELLSKLSLEQDDAINVAERLAQVPVTSCLRPDICYLDPMFPPRAKSAAVRKNMSILHGLLKTQSYDDKGVREREEADLLLAALAAARQKVVVKRPMQAPPLGGDLVRKKPSSMIKGSVNRWDVYAI